MIPIPKLAVSRLAVKLALGIACLLALALLVHDRNRWQAKAAQYAALLAAERGAHAGTVAAYRAAAQQARQADIANAARVRSRQAAINERSEDAFEKRLADARAAAGRLRPQAGAAAGHPGAGRAAPVPGLSPAAGRAAQAAGEDRLPDSGDALIATEQAIQLDELIRWVERQAAVEVNGR
jgi:hypothetical protein